MKPVVLLAIVALGSLAAPAFADGGGVRGVVYDRASHDGLAGVDVSVSGPAGVVHTFSDRNGFFVFLGLLPGTYTISLEKDGYRSFRCTRTVAELQVDSDQVRDVALELAKAPLAIGHILCFRIGEPEKLEPSLVDPNATADVYDVH